MIIRNKETKELDNIKRVNIKFHGTFSDIINHSTAKFMSENTHPKVFYVDLIDKDGEETTRRYNITTTERLHGLLADLRYTLIGEKGYIIKSLYMPYKPKQMIKDEQNNLTSGIIQDPVLYTVIFNNTLTKTNE